MTDLQNKVRNLKVAVACILSEPWEESDLDEVLHAIDTIFPEEYFTDCERNTNDW